MKRKAASVNVPAPLLGSTERRRDANRAGPSGRPRRPAFAAARYFAAMALFGVASAAFSLLAIPLSLVLPRGTATRLGRFAISAGFRAYLRVAARLGILRVDLSELDALRDEPGLVVAANHPSIADAVLLVSRLPRAACIMKGSLADSRILGGGARLAGYIRNTSRLTLMRDAVACLREGGQLVVFPEGTRTRCATVDAFTAGFAAVARHADAPIQTVVIETARRAGWRRSLLSVPDLPLVYRVRLGRRYPPCADPRATARAVEDDLRLALQPRGEAAGSGPERG